MSDDSVTEFGGLSGDVDELNWLKAVRSRLLALPNLEQELVPRMLREPQVSNAAAQYVESSERSEDFKAYVAGQEKGYASGHEAGFAKGVVIGGFGVLSAMAMAMVARSHR